MEKKWKRKRMRLWRKLEFEGEYINGKGKGKKYQHDQIIFEAECLNGKRNREGREYKHGKLNFEGEYLNGKRNRKGKEYKYDRLIYEVEYFNGEKNGKGSI